MRDFIVAYPGALSAGIVLFRGDATGNGDGDYGGNRPRSMRWPADAHGREAYSGLFVGPPLIKSGAEKVGECREKCLDVIVGGGGRDAAVEARREQEALGE